MKIPSIRFLISRHRYFLSFLILGLSVFALGMTYDFIWLDKIYILYNSDLTPFDIHKLFTLTGFTGGGHYRPLTATYYSFLLNVFGDKAFVFKVIQFYIHLANAFLVFALFKKCMKEKLAFFLSLIFLIHPMNVVSTTFISAAAGPLFMFFGLSALLISQNEKINVLIRSIAIFPLLLLSALSREEGAFFVLFVLLFNFLYRRKTFLYTVVPAVLAILVYLHMRFNIAGIKYETLELVPIMRLSLVERLYHIPAIIGYYLKTFFFPAQLVTNQQWTITSLSLLNFYLPAVFIVCLAGILIFALVHFKQKDAKLSYDFAFFAVWFCLSMSLYLHIIPLDYTVSNRWFYLPMIGVLGMIGVALNRFKVHFNKSYLKLVVIILIVILSSRSFVRTTDWKDEATLFGHDAVILTNFSTESNLGNALYKEGKYQEALVHFKKSVELFPYDINLILLAQTYGKLNDLENAKKYYILAAKTHSYGPGYHDKIIYKLAAGFLVQLDGVAAKEVIEAGLKAYPDSYRLRSLHAVNEYRLGNVSEAIIIAVETLQKNRNELTTNLVTDLINRRDIVIDNRYIN